MNRWFVVALAVTGVLSQGAELVRPTAGKTEIFHLKDIRPGMQATAWTVFQGTVPEAVPIEIVGVLQKGYGLNDIILGKMGGRAKETNVAAGMSGSPVYIDGKLVGAVALRLSVFSPDAICGITPIESMLQINDFDTSRPADAPMPGGPATLRAAAAADLSNPLLAQVVAAGGALPAPQHAPLMTPIATPLMFSGFTEAALRTFQPLLDQMGITAVQGGASAASLSAKPAPGWQKALNPGESVSAVLVSGDLSTTGMGTVTYNDGKRVLAFGHSLMNLGPVDIPMAKADVLMTLASSYQPTKYGNTTDVVGALHQDRFSGIMGELGEEAPMVPVHLRVRSLDSANKVVTEKDLNFNVFVHQKWTPYLMMLTLSNSLQQINEYADEITYRLSGNVQVAGGGDVHVSTMLAGSETQVAPPAVLASWWGDKFNRLFLNPVAMPKLNRVDCTVDLLPDRREATIDSAWTPSDEVEAGSSIPVKVFLRPYRGERIERDVTIHIPAGLPKGEHRILFSDADTLNRMQSGAASGDRYMDIPETVSLLNQERSNNRLYVSLVQGRATYYADDKTMPLLPASLLNVLRQERTASRSLVGTPETAQEQLSLPFDQMVSGSYSLAIKVK
jgi:hypothetical protein